MKETNRSKKLLEAKRKTSLKHVQYLSKQREYLKGDEIFMREAHLLLELEDEIPLTMSELAENLEVTQGAITQMAKRLETKEYLYRQQNPEDKRSSLVYLTDKGRNLIKSHRMYDKKMYRFIDDHMSDYSDEDIELLIKYEERLLNLFFESEEL